MRRSKVARRLPCDKRLQSIVTNFDPVRAHVCLDSESRYRLGDGDDVTRDAEAAGDM